MNVWKLKVFLPRSRKVTTRFTQIAAAKSQVYPIYPHKMVDLLPSPILFCSSIQVEQVEPHEVGGGSFQQ